MSIFDMYEQAMRDANGPANAIPFGGTQDALPPVTTGPGWGPGVGSPQAASVADTLGGGGGNAPQMPGLPPGTSGGGDVSGFANYGMQAPQLPDAMGAIAQIMKMMGDPHANQKEDPFQQQQAGGIMQYLQSLGV